MDYKYDFIKRMPGKCKLYVFLLTLLMLETEYSGFGGQYLKGPLDGLDQYTRSPLNANS